jgi:rhodanese-related sulfurtransferase
VAVGFAVPAAEPESGFRYVQPAALREMLRAGEVTFLDVRDPDEFVAGHLPEARNIPYDAVASLAPELPRKTPIVLYCIHSAHRAQAAARALAGLGFDNLFVLEGGIVAWQAGGQTILASDPGRAPTILPKSERCAALEKAGH